MPAKNLHEEPFDDVTITKLEIFEEYAEAWLPTFIMQKSSPIYIYDFFAGTGYDIKGIPGSPIRILEKIKKFKNYLFTKNVKIVLFFNEFDLKKFTQLTAACNAFMDTNTDLHKFIDLHYCNNDFDKIFFKLIPVIQKHPSLVYLDQNGLKYLSNKYLLELEKSQQTDFIYFASSCYLRRFGNLEEFKEHIKIDMGVIKNTPYRFIHEVVFRYVKDQLPDGTKIKLYPFSLKKGLNIHGIIFGASHLRAVDKFLGIAWKKNDLNGQANFDINDDGIGAPRDLFDQNKITKVQGFQNKLKEKIKIGEVKNNADALHFTYAEGHIPAHARECLSLMKKSGEITYISTTPLISWNKVFDEHVIVEYQKIKK